MKLKKLSALILIDILLFRQIADNLNIYDVKSKGNFRFAIVIERLI